MTSWGRRRRAGFIPQNSVVAVLFVVLVECRFFLLLWMLRIQVKKVDGIIMEFAAVEIGVGEAVNEKSEKFQANFTSGK